MASIIVLQYYSRNTRRECGRDQGAGLLLVSQNDPVDRSCVVGVLDNDPTSVALLGRDAQRAA